MRVFKVSDGTSWLVRPDGDPQRGKGIRSGWESILFERQPGGLARLVYRPAGWLDSATDADLAAALMEGETVRAHWGTPGQ